MSDPCDTLISAVSAAPATPAIPNPRAAGPTTVNATTQTHNVFQTVRFVLNGQVAELERERDYYKTALRHEQKLLRVAMDLVQLRDEEIAELRHEKKVAMVVLGRLVRGLRVDFREERREEGEEGDEVGGAAAAAAASAGVDDGGESEGGGEKGGKAGKSEDEKQEANRVKMPKIKLKRISREQERARAMMTDLNQLDMNGQVVQHAGETASSQEERPVATDGGT